MLLLTVLWLIQDSPDFSFDKELARLKGGDSKVNYKALRMGWAKQADYNPYELDSNDELGEIFDQIDAAEYEKAETHLKKLLEQYYLNPRYHMCAIYLYRKMGKTELESFHTDVVVGLHKSIWEPDGCEDPDHPCVVLSVDEEYFFCDLLELEVKEQSLSQCGSVPCDQLTVLDPESGETFDVWFDIHLPTDSLMKELTKPKQ